MDKFKRAERLNQNLVAVDGYDGKQPNNISSLHSSNSRADGGTRGSKSNPRPGRSNSNLQPESSSRPLSSKQSRHTERAISGHRLGNNRTQQHEAT